MTDPDNTVLPRLGVLLGALTDREADQFEETAASTLAVLAPMVAPPAGLLEAVLARIDDAGGQQPVATPAGSARPTARHRAEDGTAHFGPHDGPLAERLAASAPDVRRGHASFLEDSATVAVVASPKAKRAVVRFDGLPAAPDGRIYQLWLIRGGRPKAAGTFAVLAKGPTELQIARRFRDGDTVAVTVEPARGSRRPTSTPLFALQP